MRNALLLLSFCLIANNAVGQIVVKSEYQLHEPVEYSLQEVENAKALWEIRPLNGQTNYSSKQYGTVHAFWGQAGQYELIATIVTVDFEAKTFEIKKETATFSIGGVPPTPVPPTPVPPIPPTPVPDANVPNDEFDNLGQRLDGLADQIGLQFDLRNRVAEVYETAASRMSKPGGYLRIQDVKAFIEDELRKLNLDSSWERTVMLLKEDAEKRTPMSWEAAYNWYRAVAAGYKGSKLSTLPALWKASPSPLQILPASSMCPTGVCNVK